MSSPRARAPVAATPTLICKNLRLVRNDNRSLSPDPLPRHGDLSCLKTWAKLPPSLDCIGQQQRLIAFAPQFNKSAVISCLGTLSRIYIMRGGVGCDLKRLRRTTTELWQTTDRSARRP